MGRRKDKREQPIREQRRIILHTLKGGKRGEEKPPVKRALTQGKIILNLTKSDADAEMRPCTDIPDEAPSTHIVEGGEPFEGEECRASFKKNLRSEKNG